MYIYACPSPSPLPSNIPQRPLPIMTTDLSRLAASRLISSVSTPGNSVDMMYVFGVRVSCGVFLSGRKVRWSSERRIRREIRETGSIFLSQSKNMF
jgi:hypothetical protein